MKSSQKIYYRILSSKNVARGQVIDICYFTDMDTVGVSRGYTDHHQGRAIHMADSRIH